MGIDRHTELSYWNFVFDDNPAYLKEMREQAKEDGQNDDKDGTKKLSLTGDKHTFSMEEYYFDESECELVISGRANSSNGSTYMFFSVPLSDEILIDILQHSIKRLNKLKTAMETLK